MKKLRKELAEKNEELRETKFDEGSFSAEVELIGEVDDLSDDGITHCFVPDLSVKVKEIKQVSPIQYISREEVVNLNNQK